MTDIVISREAAVEALRRTGFLPVEGHIESLMTGCGDSATRQIARLLDELWQACPDKRPVDKRVVAMQHALGIYADSHPWDIPALVLAAFDDKLAELDRGE